MCVDMTKQDLFSFKRSNYLRDIMITATVLFVLSFSVGSTPASAHTLVNVENIRRLGRYENIMYIAFVPDEYSEMVKCSHLEK